MKYRNYTDKFIELPHAAAATFGVRRCVASRAGPLLSHMSSYVPAIDNNNNNEDNYKMRRQ